MLNFKDTNKRNILVVGASSRIGVMLRRLWNSASPANINFIYQYRSPANLRCELQWEPLLGDRALAQYQDRECAIDAMLILSGVTPSSGGDFDLNATLVDACLKAARNNKIKRVLLASSSAVYGINNGVRFTETSNCNPVTTYGYSKLRMEIMASNCLYSEMDICSMRIGNVVGADALLSNNSLNQLTIDRFVNGRGPIRSYIGPISLASIICRLITFKQRLPRVINIGAPTPVEMASLATAAQLNWSWTRADASAHQNIVLDCDKAAKLFPFSHDISSPDNMVKEWNRLRAIT